VLRAISVIPMLFAALILRTDRRIVEELRQARAVSIASAIPLHTPPLFGGWRIERLTGAGAICLVGPNGYYLDEEGYAAYRKRRRRRVVLVLGILLPLILIMWLWLNAK
jgi:hypothetical protein